MIPSHITLNAVYYLESKNEGMNPIAIRPDVRAGYISWEDTGHGRMIRYGFLFFDGKEVEAPLQAPAILPQRISVITQRGEYQLVRLTKQIFDDKVKAGVGCKGSLNFTNDDEVQHHYLTTRFE